MIAVRDIAYVRHRAPTLDRMEQFLAEFGLTRAKRRSNALYIAGTGAQPFCRVTEPGASHLKSFAATLIRRNWSKMYQRLS